MVGQNTQDLKLKYLYLSFTGKFSCGVREIKWIITKVYCTNG